MVLVDMLHARFWIVPEPMAPAVAGKVYREGNDPPDSQKQAFQKAESVIWRVRGPPGCKEV